ncbi:ABC transporter ATP-binding protein [Phytoactinopolyspora mesophila]|uniref:ATP-binding cassette domain-containing protein n=1 Tax=Phytoactinopolyspora mesophila TaxID=2650750 RepID=A0A7K3M0I4_9ACTN|nr:ATP-binding cassette domain-containing protein [Phytoactinopolyspora mesophila]NDL56811.1 ATP-binding cassette domain-containing protein [Phytoactinopolyspora mesophila]
MNRSARVSSRVDTAEGRRVRTVPDIVAERLTIDFRGADGAKVTIAEDLSFSLGAGDVCCLLGRSGSGKTSLLRVAAAMAAPVSGRVTWWGADIQKMGDDERRMMRRTRIGYMDQAASMVRDLTVLENVLIPVMPEGRAAVAARLGAARDLLEGFALGGHLDATTATLSSGERQRVCLARAMINDPSVLILDEPTASLDRGLADLVIDMLTEHASAGGAVLVASHDPHVAESATSVIRLETD